MQSCPTIACSFPIHSEMPSEREGGQTVKPGGMHGYLPDLADMNATFLIEGVKISRGRSLGQIDMRDIAPTPAAILGICLPAAEGRNLLEEGK